MNVSQKTNYFVPIKELNGAYKTKSYKYGTVYIADLFNSMYLVIVEIPNSSDDFSKTFFYTESTKTQQRTSARRCFNKLRQLLAKGDYEAIEETLS